MGQAKYRGSQQQRIVQAKQRLASEVKSAEDSGLIKDNTDEIKNKIAQVSVEQFAGELKLPTVLLLAQLKSAGINKASGDQLSEADKTALLDHLRKEHGTIAPKNKITLTRKSSTEIKKTSNTVRARTLQVEVRKKRVLEPLNNSVAVESHVSRKGFLKISRLHLENLGRFQDLWIDFALNSNVTVFVGKNGAGKTSILKALATSLSWFVARLRRENGNGSPIPEIVIFNGMPSANIDVTLFDYPNGTFGLDTEIGAYSWSLAKVRAGKKGSHVSQFNDLTRLADEYRHTFTKDSNASLPLIAFYSTERVVLDIPLKIKGKHSFLQLDGYHNSLNQGVDFRTFFEWFREREDAENESVVSQKAIDNLLGVFENNPNIPPNIQQELWGTLNKLNASSKDRQLTAVRTAIYNFMPGFSKLMVKRKPTLHMSIEKESKALNVLQLSQGEKSLMALVGDIARRLAMMNPALENPLTGGGIVLIDEIEMHLHPEWQQTVVGNLEKTFPNIQFIITTHSPHVLSSIDASCIRLLRQEDDVETSNIVTSIEEVHTQTKGVSSADVLAEIMGVNPVPNVPEAKALSAYHALIQENLHQTDNGLELREELDTHFGYSHPVMLECERMIRLQALKQKFPVPSKE